MQTITMMQLRRSPGEFAHLVSRHGQSILVTSGGKPVFKMVPVGDEQSALAACQARIEELERENADLLKPG